MDNIHSCEHCGNPIDYDTTDWCDKCNTSIFDEKICTQCEEEQLVIAEHLGVLYWYCPNCDSTFAL